MRLNAFCRGWNCDFPLRSKRVSVNSSIFPLLEFSPSLFRGFELGLQANKPALYRAALVNENLLHSVLQEYQSG